ncbi:MAG: hexokinase [Spirochaetia bacterium]|nr:hexokinase [Spirochaetia bacterium]
MDKTITRTLQFLEKYKLHEQAIDMNSSCDSFLGEMKKGLIGDSSGSLAMIPTYTAADAEIKGGDKVIVLDAGGTNFRVALVTFDEDLNPVISHYKKTGMPGVHHEVSASEFFSILADGVEPIIHESNYIGFCFSYAATITPQRDGIPIVFSKEIKAPQVIGKRVGASLLEELANRGYDVKEKKVAVLNDTVATLLAGKASKDSSDYSTFIGFILGTGTNTAYIENNNEIKKLPHLPLGNQIVNVESGNYDLTVGPIDELFFQTTKDPSIYHFEKIISGAYLGAFSRLVIEKAIEEGLLSKEFSSLYKRIEPINTTRMSNYLEMPLNKEYDLVKCITNEEDATALYLLLDSIIRRAAKLTAINLSAAVLSTQGGINPRHPVLINADGTTFYKTEKLEFYTKMYLDEFLTKQHHRYYKIVQIDNSPIIGAAVAPLV